VRQAELYVGKDMISKPIKVLLAATLIGGILLHFSSEWIREKTNKQNLLLRQQVVQRYAELVAQGKLEQPSEGFQAVSVISQHGGEPFHIWFWNNDPSKRKYRYFAARKKNPDGQFVLQFQDTNTEQYIY
jgi:hypothetical protein